MKLRSFAFDGVRLVPIEVELTLWPGLPMIQILGLPDQQIKESAARIKSAIKAQGFKFPKSQQILVNLRPNSLKKSSSGVELAVALAYLLETEQVQLNEQTLQNLFVYGELNLNGEVVSPKEFQVQFEEKQNWNLLTGISNTPQSFCGFKNKAQISTLSSLNGALEFINTENQIQCERPKIFDQTMWTPSQADILAVTAFGEHHVLLVGSAGAGKTTLGCAVNQLMNPPQSGSNPWRPFVRPHHSIPPISMIGGGAQATGGEITRAHQGLLFLDEFLEFDPAVIENLREPIEEGVIRIARGNYSRTLPADFQMVATSNLCPCGNWTTADRKSKVGCRYSRKKCRSYSDRFSGPLLDRFHLVAFVNRTKEERTIATGEILKKIERATEFKQKEGRVESNAKMPIKQIEEGLKQNSKNHLLPDFHSSERRRIAMLRVARTLADLDQEPQILPRHLQKSMEWTVNNFERLSRWDA